MAGNLSVLVASVVFVSGCAVASTPRANTAPTITTTAITTTAITTTAITTTATTTTATSATSAPVARAAGGIPIPDPHLTPGAMFHVTRTQVCVVGYTKTVRSVSDATKNAVFAEYGIRSHAPYSYEVDHLISLELGGSNDIRNLWPEPYAGSNGARAKDAVENRLHRQVCAGEISLAKAQAEIVRWWLLAR